MKAPQRKVRVIEPGITGHTTTEQTVEDLAAMVEGKRKVVAINGVQVHTVEDFLRAVDACRDTPEVWVFPPMAGG